jgi:flagellar protein FliS
MQSAARAYMKTQVNTTSQESLVLMLYDGALNFLKSARERMLEKDYAQKGILISNALDVIAELDGSLNREKGGEVSENLHKLYILCHSRLLKANMNMDVEQLDEVITMLSDLRSAFAQIMPKGPTQTNASPKLAGSFAR